MGIKVILTGGTGMVGKGVLIECLESDLVESVLSINRTSLNIEHPKLKEIIHKNFLDFSDIKEDLTGYNACFYCLGISSLGMSEKDYFQITYSLTEALANVLLKSNPGMIFNFISGAGTDSSEKGKIMWARVKGKTENMILKKGFKDAYAFRPGGIIPVKGVRSKTWWVNMIYTITKPLHPALNKMDSIVDSSEIGKAMINSCLHSIDDKILESKDIKKIAGMNIPV